jgi:3-oxoacyl-[acyl-carrier-protein] synthase-3
MDFSMSSASTRDSVPRPHPAGSAPQPFSGSDAAPRSGWSVLTGIQVLSTGSYVPPQIVTNADLSSLGCDEQWILQRTGIRERRKASAELATSDLAREAALDCLREANVQPRELDLIIVCTMTPDHATPSTACLLQNAIGASCGAMDLNAACSGFMYGLITGGQFVRTGCARRVLVVGADVMTRAIDPTDVKTYPLFGDGAAAVLLGAGDNSQGLLSYSLGSDGSGAALLNAPGGGSREPLTPQTLAASRQYMRMDGRPVFKWAVKLVEESLLGAMERAGVTSDEVAAVVLHQANSRILDAAVSDLGFGRDKVIMNLDRYGNTSAGSIPLVLDEAAKSGRIQRGDLVLLCGFGAGLTWGVGLMRW